MMSDFDVRAGDQQFVVTVQDAGDGLEVAIDGRVHRVALKAWVEPTHFVVSGDGASTPVTIERAADGLRLTLGSDQHHIQISPRVPIQRRGATDRPVAADVRVVAPMPGVVAGVQVGLGSEVEEGDAVVVMEAMKMQMEIRAPRSGRVSAIFVQPGQEVARGQLLATLKSDRL